MPLFKAQGVLCALSLVFFTACGSDKIENVQVFQGMGFEVRSTYVSKAFSFDTQCVQFDSAAGQSQAWHRFLESCSDLADDFAEQDLHFLSREVSYLAYNGDITVTTNAGRNWSTWSANQYTMCQTQKLACKANEETVKIAASGVGSMALTGRCVYPAKTCLKTIHLRTDDFGKTWRE
jgi:hypothetical protein